MYVSMYIYLYITCQTIKYIFIIIVKYTPSYCERCILVILSSVIRNTIEDV